MSRTLSFMLLLFVASLALADEPTKPNVILIMADDIAYDNVGCYGSQHFQTPRLDELARTGVKFNFCYSEPVCTSSRVKIMTGRDNIRNYTVFGKLDPKEKTFGTMMKEAGYATAIAGKWQLHGNDGALAPGCGFDTFCLWNYPGTERERYWNPSLIRDGQEVPVTEDSYGPDVCTEFLIEFIKKNKDRPFFAYYPMLSVHAPFLPTPDSADRNSKHAATNYRDMVKYMDKCVGRLVDVLDQNRLRENTIVMFTTDNGTNTSLKYPYKGEMRDGEKAYPTDGGCHAPLIVNCPGIVTAGAETDDLVDFSDVLPTLAEIGEAQLPDVTLDGRSFWPQCVGKKGNPREWIFQYYYPKLKDAAKQHGEGKPYIIWAQDQHYKLYSHGKFIEVEDRHEVKNISPGMGSQQAEDARKKLQAAIDSMPRESESAGSKATDRTPKKTPPKAAKKPDGKSSNRPNIVLMMSDDQGWGETAYNGHPHLKTPILDLMAASGLRLHRFYAASPICSPTRASVLTGRHANRTGAFGAGWSIRPEEVTLAPLMKAAGFRTAHAHNATGDYRQHAQEQSPHRAT